MRRVVRLGLGVGLLVLVLTTTDVSAVARTMASVDLALVLPGLGALVAVHVVPAVAWRRMVALGGQTTLGLPDAIRAYYAGQALGGITPANLGGDVYRVAALRRSGAGVAEAAGPVAVQRGTSFLALGAIGVAGVTASASSPGVGAAVVIAAVAAAAVGIGSRVLIAPPRWLPARLTATLGGGTHARTPRAMVAVGLGSGLAFHAIAIAATWLILIGTDRALAAPTVLAAVAASRLSLAIPITPSGIGVGEGVLAALVGGAGRPAGAAVAGMLVARLALIATTVVGAGLIALDGRSGSPLGRSAGPTTPRGAGALDRG